MIKLDTAVIESAFGPLQSTANGDIAEVMITLANALKDEHEGNEYAAKIWEQCAKAQNRYNTEFVPVLEDMIANFKENIDLAEWLAKKAQAKELQNANIDVKLQKNKPSRINM